MFVCLGFGHFILFVYFFPWPRSSKGNSFEWGVNSLKTSIFPLPSPLRGCRSLLEIVFFLGQCEVFVCLGFGHFILFVYFFPWPRNSKDLRMGRQIL